MTDTADVPDGTDMSGVAGMHEKSKQVYAYTTDMHYGGFPFSFSGRFHACLHVS